MPSVARGKLGPRRPADAAEGGVGNLPARLAKALCAVALCLPAGPASAARWEFFPSFAAAETYTDNVRLSARGTEESDWVTQLSPRLLLRGSGDRLRLDVDYFPQFLWWSREGSSRFINLYDANGTLEVVKETFFLDARLARSQENVSLLGPLSDSNVYLTGNRTSVRSSVISPYVRHDFGAEARGEARFSYSTVDTGSRELVDNHATVVDAKITSGPAFRAFTWYAAYYDEHIDYDDPQIRDTTIQKISAGGKRLITPQIGLLANAGYEDNDFVTIGPEPRGPFWNVGPEWTPSPRTRLAATIGHRFFGATRSFEFSHRTRMTSWNASYTEDVVTSRDLFLLPATSSTASHLDALFRTSIPDAAARQSAVAAFIARNGLPSSLGGPLNFFSSVPFLAKRLQGSFGLNGVRNTVFADVYTETREALAPNQPGAGDFGVSEKTKQTGVHLFWTSAITALLTSHVSAGTRRTEFEVTGRKDTERFFRLGLTRQFYPRLAGTLIFRRLQNSSTESGAGYRENSVSVNVVAKF